MKKVASLLTIVFFATVCNAQLANTQWAGEMAVPSPTNILLRFTADTVQMIIKDGGFVGETMVYSVKDSLITLTKISGNSPCSAGDAFTISYIMKDDKLWLNPVFDRCDERSSAWPTEPFFKTEFK
jgi:hypothetical protein